MICPQCASDRLKLRDGAYHCLTCEKTFKAEDLESEQVKTETIDEYLARMKEQG